MVQAVRIGRGCGGAVEDAAAAACSRWRASRFRVPGMEQAAVMFRGSALGTGTRQRTNVTYLLSRFDLIIIN
jgi:hypothetical protein